MEGESAFGYLNRALELDLSEYSRRLEKRCEDASRSKALRAKVIRSLIRFRESFLECALPARPCAGVLASLCYDGAKAMVLLDV
jgi:hypothetical protein